MRWLDVLVLALVLAATATARAQYAIPWHTIDSGGGAATGIGSDGTGFRLSGTVGQPDAEVVPLCSGASCTGATYALTGGFWVEAASVPTCGADLGCLFRDGFEP